MNPTQFGLPALVETANRSYETWANARTRLDDRLGSDANYPSEAERRCLGDELAAALDDLEPRLYAVAACIGSYVDHLDEDGSSQVLPDFGDAANWLVEAADQIRLWSCDDYEVAYDWTRHTRTDDSEGVGELVAAFANRLRCTRLHTAARRAQFQAHQAADGARSDPRPVGTVLDRDRQEDDTMTLTPNHPRLAHIRWVRPHDTEDWDEERWEQHHQWRCRLPVGWVGLFNDLLASLDTVCNAYRISLVREKWGELEVFAECTHHGQVGTHWKAIVELCAATQARSRTVCDVCGEPGDLLAPDHPAWRLPNDHLGFLVRTRCPRHYGARPALVDARQRPDDWTEFGPFFDADALAVALGVRLEELAGMVDRNEIIAVHPSEGTPVFPAWQFGRGLVPQPVLLDLWQRLRVGTDEWTALIWLKSPQELLGGISAADWIPTASHVDTRLSDLRNQATRDAARWRT